MQDLIRRLSMFIPKKESGKEQNRTMKYWIRPASLTTEAKQGELAELFEKFASAPFVDRINNRASMEHIRRGYLEDFIRESNSSLIEELNVRSLEEAVVNAVLHKNYKEDVPVEIRVYLDQIQIINFPGPDHYIDMEKFAAGKVRARRYRNPKIGEFFKEIDLSEKKSTGISKILRELKRNGSPLPEFETDADRTYMITTIKIHKGFNFGNFAQKNERSLSGVLSEVLAQKDYNKVRAIVNFMEEHGEITPKEAEAVTGKSAATVRRYFKMLAGTKYIVAEGNTNNIVYRISMNLPEDD